MRVILLEILLCPYAYCFVANPSFGLAKNTRPLVHQPLSDRSAAVEDEIMTVTVPRFVPDEIETGSYPSKLHRIHIQRVLSDDEATMCLDLARRHARATGRWDQPDHERHATYATCDFPVEECEDLAAYLEELDFHSRIWDRLSRLFDISPADMAYLDFFCVNYQANQSSTQRTMDGLEAHRDGSLLSFTVLLSNSDSFSGGGTFFDALRDVEPDDETSVLHKGGVIRPLHAGTATFHSGKLLHGADTVTAGERTVLVGFVDVADWVQRPGALAAACRDFGRMDVASLHFKRQQERTNHGETPGWILNNERWLSGHSHLRGFIPAFSSVAKRADPEYQRQKKLQAEDILLRSILLSESEQKQRQQEREEALFHTGISLISD